MSAHRFTRAQMIASLRDFVRVQLVDAEGNVNPCQILEPEFAEWIASPDGREQLRRLRIEDADRRPGRGQRSLDLDGQRSFV